MSNQKIAKEWLQIALEDYDIAQFLYKTKHPRPLEIICYHSQQSVEKSLKAYLCANDAEIPKTHDTGHLCYLCAQFNDGFEVFFEQCKELELYATGTRYPSRIEVDDTNTERALRQAYGVYEFAVQQVNGLSGAKTKRKQ